MTSEEPRKPKGDDGCPPPRDDSGCDASTIDTVACRAAGVAAQATYDQTYTSDLEAAKQTYSDVRTQYRASRQAAAVPYKEMRHQIKHLLERIRCMIEQRRVWVCLDEAYCEVIGEVECCSLPPGCCAKARTFDVSGGEDMSLRVLERLITRYQRWTDEAKACFDNLAKEPDQLTARVAAAQQLIKDIDTALSGDPATTDLKQLYVRARVAAWTVDQIYGGFAKTQDFADCLCLALTTWTAGCAAVSELTRIEAYKKCCDDQAVARCDALKAPTVEEILAAYDRLGGGDPCHKDDSKDNDCHDSGGGDDSDDHGSDDGGPADDDCGCGHHHHQHHHHHHGTKGCGCHDDDDDDDGDDDGDDSKADGKSDGEPDGGDGRPEAS